MTPSRRLAVCSWSLRPASPEDLAAQVRAAGLRRVQLAWRPFVEGAWDVARARRVFAAAEIRVVSGMMEPLGEDYSTLESIEATGGLRPDATWEANLDIARRSAALSLAFGVELTTFHAGFLPAEDGAERRRMLGRLRAVRDVFAAARLRLGLETGQESVAVLEAALDAVGPGVGVNFDPANLVLYGAGDPLDAARRLARRVVQVHLKDARPAARPKTWGEEVPFGTGVVPWERIFGVLAAAGVETEAVVEREAGDRRFDDVRAAVEASPRLGGPTP